MGKGILDSFRLDGKVALVTGASAGLGAAMALGLAEAGADVACHGNSRSPAETAASIAELGCQAASIQGDLALQETPARIVKEVIDRFGRIDILINNAGTVRRAPAVDYALADWNALIQINLTSLFQLSQLAGRDMLTRGRGRIVNIASILSFQGGITVPAYAAAKGGVAQMTKALANEWASKGINVNAIAPGYIRTDNTEALQHDETRNRQILERIPAGRWGEPRDLCGAVVFLCSDASDYIHGQLLIADGGWMGR
ncbi:MAG: 2-dehydro-3-deoxy-D-gluconate 5-dehydrogenase KduD [Bryobacteraceae bacterium]|jgi:2-deoxy-D-gluconate 3-dehydrogenase